jgi:hypothetical protein
MNRYEAYRWFSTRAAAEIITPLERGWGTEHACCLDCAISRLIVAGQCDHIEYIRDTWGPGVAGDNISFISDRGRSLTAVRVPPTCTVHWRLT